MSSAGICGVLLVLATQVDDAAAPRTGDVVFARCKFEYKHKTALSASTSGVLQDCLVRAGDRVAAGQVLGHLQNSDVTTAMEVKAARSRSEIAIRLSEAKYAFLLGRLKSSEKLFTRGLLSADDYNSHKLEAESARIAIEADKFEKEMAGLEFRQAQAMVKSRELVSPLNGIVIDVLKSPGEAIGGTGNDPVFRIADTRQIKVTGFVDIGDAWRVKAGQHVEVRADVPGIDLPVEKLRFPGQVVFVDRMVQSETQVTRVVAEITDPGDQLRDGLAGLMEVRLGPEQSADAPAPAPAPADPPPSAGPDVKGPAAAPAPWEKSVKP